MIRAAGVRQWIDCRGTGPLTVVVIPGLATAANAWQQVLPAFRRVTRTCIYDRPGLGDSPARPDAHQILDAGLFARELHDLLAAAGEPGPYVLVGHSFGGLIARAFVAQFPQTIRGLLLAESVTPDDPSNGPFWSEAGHRIDMAKSSAATDDGPKLGNTPLLVVSASDPQGDHLGGPTYGQPAWMIALWRREQAEDTTLFDGLDPGHCTFGTRAPAGQPGRDDRGRPRTCVLRPDRSRLGVHPESAGRRIGLRQMSADRRQTEAGERT